ncbi:hypothetical protein P5G51_015430 [Virgibacillus sp. 179-BFC.A HS]|uniref:Uncharacterized protein n=1 Tax=Tigheibacillus jepli TaxID=3035914 RepID=A0ABU5CM90_9BACI|nr:hypothetical protein [Virgibacillus sp. 179-BFC.A HS]MDY0406570.1 hypothetical protein [Virgibacillus sp. 179-BFC.A HS]
MIKSAKEKYPDFHADINKLNDQATVKMSSQNPFVKLTQVVAKSLGSEIKLGGMTGYTDGANSHVQTKSTPLLDWGRGIHLSCTSLMNMSKLKNI